MRRVAAQRHLAIALLGELFGRKLAHAFVEREADAARARHRPQQRLVAQRLDPVERARRIAERRAGRLDREAAAEDRTARQRHALRVVEQIPRPLDRAAQRGLPRRHAAQAAREQIEAALQTPQHPAHAEHVGAGRRELDRRRDPLELAHQRGHGGDVLARRRGGGALREDAIDEEIHGLGRLIGIVGRGQAQGRELVAHLAGEARALARGDQEADLGRHPHPAIEGRRRLGDHLLEVVGDEERRPLRREDPADPLDDGRVPFPGSHGCLQSAGDRAADGREIA